MFLRQLFVVGGWGWEGKRGQNFVPATRCIKFSSFKFVRHLGRDKMVSVFNVASCAPACIKLLPVPATYVLREHKRGLFPASRPLKSADRKKEEKK